MPMAQSFPVMRPLSGAHMGTSLWSERERLLVLPPIPLTWLLARHQGHGNCIFKGSRSSARDTLVTKKSDFPLTPGKMITKSVRAAEPGR